MTSYSVCNSLCELTMFVYNVYLHLVDVNSTDDTVSTVKYKMNIPLGFSREFILSISRDNAFRYFLRTSKPVTHTHVQALRNLIVSSHLFCPDFDQLKKLHTPKGSTYANWAHIF